MEGEYKMTTFNPVKTLNKRSFQQNKGRNFVAITAITLTTMMFTTLFVLAQSMKQNLVEMNFRQTGYNAQVSIKSITKEQASQLSAHPDVKELGNSIVLGLAENQKLGGRQLEIRWADNSYASHSFALPTTGSMPQTADEIALDTLTLDRLGIPQKLGQTVSLEWRKDTTNDTITTSVFKLCGYWESNLSSYAGMAWVSEDFAQELTKGQPALDGQVLGIRMAQISLYSSKNIEAAMDKILSDTGLNGLTYNINLAYSPEMNASAAQESLPMYLGMLLVFAAGYLIIYNIFQISVTADIQFYGKLKTLGASARQLKKLIYGQANRLCLIGIPLGIITGYLLGMLLVPLLLSIMNSKVTTSANPIIFIGSALFAWLTVVISCLRPARLAGKVSPIEALRYREGDGGSYNKNKKSRNGSSLSGMAWSNLGRNKKRTFIVICSLTLGLVLLSTFYAKDASFDINKYLSSLTISDFAIADASHEDWIHGYNPQGDTLNQELMSRIASLEGLKETGHMYTHETLLDMDQPLVDNLQNFYTPDKLRDWAAYDPKGAQDVQDAIANRQAVANLYGLDGIPLDTLTKEENCLSGSFNADQFATGQYVLAISPSLDKESLEENPLLPTPSVGSTVTIEGRTYSVMAVVLPSDPITGGNSEIDTNSSFHLPFILPLDTFHSLWPENTLRKFFFNVDAQHLNAAQEMIDDYTQNYDSSMPVTSRQSKSMQYKQETTSSAVMGNAVSIIIALVGVLNFINSMVTAIVSRRREFAMIQSVGMTKKQLCKMLVYEGLFYAGLTLIVSYILSALTVGFGVRAMVADGYSTFRFTLAPLLACTPVILAFAVLIPYLCFRNLDQHSIVERLRMD